MTVCVGYLHPTEGGITGSFHRSLINLLMAEVPAGTIVGHIPVECGVDLASGRNDLTAAFLDKSDAEWLWMVDTDMGFAPDTLQQLLKSADPVDRPVVGGLCFVLKKAHDRPDPAQTFRYTMSPTIYMWEEHPEYAGFRPVEFYDRNTMVHCDATGAACLLIHRSVLEDIREEGGDVWWSHSAHPLAGVLSEDLSFCVRVAQVGRQVHVNTAVKLSHMKWQYLDEWLFDRQPTSQPLFVVAGTGRSGSGYIANLFTESGLRCGHEQWWNPYGHYTPHLIGDSSWLAVPDLPNYPGHVFHQVRHPKRVLSSLLNGDLFDDRDSRHYKFKAAHIEMTGDPTVDALNFMADWYRRIDAAGPELEWRVEDVNAELVEKVCGLLNIVHDRSLIDRAFRRIPTDFNKHPDGPSIVWSDLPDCDAKHTIEQVADRFGYDLKEP